MPKYRTEARRIEDVHQGMKLAVQISATKVLLFEAEDCWLEHTPPDEPTFHVKSKPLESQDYEPTEITGPAGTVVHEVVAITPDDET